MESTHLSLNKPTKVKIKQKFADADISKEGLNQ